MPVACKDDRCDPWLVFQNSIKYSDCLGNLQKNSFKVFMSKSQALDIWCVASCSRSLSSLFNLWLQGQYLPHPMLQLIIYRLNRNLSFFLNLLACSLLARIHQLGQELRHFVSSILKQTSIKVVKIMALVSLENGSLYFTCPCVSFFKRFLQNY